MHERVGFPLNADNNYEVDLTNFFADNPSLTMADLDIRIRNDNTNALSLPMSGTLGIEDQEIAGLQVYPNPTNGNLTIQTADTAIESIMIVNQLGQKVFYENYDTTAGYLHIETNIRDLPTGIYHLNVRGEDGRVSNRKIIKQ